MERGRLEGPWGLDRVVRANTGTPVLWMECQGEWSIGADLVPVDEPIARANTYDVEPDPPAPLNYVMLGMVCDDALSAATSATQSGCLGPLADSVYGGRFFDESPSVQEAFMSLPELEYFRNPFFALRSRGDGELIVRRQDEFIWQWMSATPDAFERACECLPIRIDEPRVLTITFACPSDHEANHLVTFDPDVADLARLKRRGRKGEGDSLTQASLTFETSFPIETLERVRKRLPEGLAAKMSAGHRSSRISRYVPVWPPEATSFDPSA